MLAVFIVLLLSLVMLAYIYAGYPAIITLISRIRPNPPHKEENTPSVTLLIPAHNEELVIAEKLENSLSVDYPREKLQIIVADDGSADRTAEIVRSYADRGVQLSSDQQRRGKIGALNRALNEATGEIVVVADADILIEPDAIRLIAANFADPEVGSVVSNTLMLEDRADTATSRTGGAYWRYESHIRQAETRIHSTVGVSGHFMAFRKELYEPVPEDVIIDDFYMAMRVLQRGYRVVLEPDAICWERPALNMEDETKRRQRMTAGRYQMIAMGREYLGDLPPILVFQVISHKFLRLAIPIFMILALVTNLTLVLFGWPKENSWLRVGLQAFLAGQGAFYAAAAGGMLMEQAESKSRLAKVLRIPYFLVATNFAALQGLKRFLSREQSVLWHQAERH